ncbi:ATP-binding protein [uncultured Bartonella sp.]|uniref:ATP-binding protein n=1 Tax=uncultured Bartonella sp. TaxID=104108 RepID=UPI0025FBC052|nr:ATP-binding protein [uncultured Bartonella sp.]
MNSRRLIQEAVLRVGEVVGISGRRIYVAIDTNKNLSELFLNGDVLRNVGVGSYVDIRKGFLGIIGRVEGENADSIGQYEKILAPLNGKRILIVSLVGYIDNSGQFIGGTKELPLVGNEVFLLTKTRTMQVHSLVSENDLGLHIGKTEFEGYEITLPIDGLMNSHLAIFGNTGSGKSNTVATIYSSFIKELTSRNAKKFQKNCKILFLDFNNEYVSDECISPNKKVYQLNTRIQQDKIPIGSGSLLNLEILSILADATEKTQKPFLKRVLRSIKYIENSFDPEECFREKLKTEIERVLSMSDKIQANLLMDYLIQILKNDNESHNLREGIEWNNKNSNFTLEGNPSITFQSEKELYKDTNLYKAAEQQKYPEDTINRIINVCYMTLIDDVLANRAQNEHIAPAINKLKSKIGDIEKTLDTTSKSNVFDESNIVIVSLGNVNLEMRKTIPLLIAKKIYEDQKQNKSGTSLNIVIDEAHNILSYESSRESEVWKDYRLETFEEIIKEGRKFGVFVTISSQRPSDISPTITSQAHNYFIHRLVNQRDLQAISSAVSYIDKLTEESIPTLPIGTCIFSGVAGKMPLKLLINPLNDAERPHSDTVKFSDLLS